MSFFKLSYPAHENIPSIVDCLKLRVNEKFGRHIVTSRRLRTGDIVVIEKAFYKSLDKELLQTRCLNCFAQLIESRIVQCSQCASVLCSRECKVRSWEAFHRHECSTIDSLTDDDGFLLMIQRSFFRALNICGNAGNLQKLIEQNHEMNIFDVNASSDTQLILACFHLEAAPATADEIKFATIFIDHLKNIWKKRQQRNFLINFVTRMIGILNRNSFTMDWDSTFVPSTSSSGCGIFPFTSLLNHSCSPNLQRIFVNDKIVLVARRPIEAGEQLFICYQ